MGAKAQVEFGFGGIRGGIKDLGDLRDALIGVEGAGKRLGASYKGLKNLWEDPANAKGGWSNATRTSAAALKLAADVAKAQASAAAGAVIGPGKTTYDQALTSYKNYRDGVQRMATATGESFGSVDKRIGETSKRLGLLPAQVQAYGSAIRRETGGTMEESLKTIDAAREQSLKTGQSIEELTGPIARLRQNFGLKSSEEVNDFFSSVDRGAKNAKISAQVARTAWEASSSVLEHVANMGPKAQAAFTSQIVGNSKNPERGTESAVELGAFLRSKAFLWNKLGQKRGLLNKGESIIDDTGDLSEKGFSVAATLAKDVLGKFHSRNGREDNRSAALRAELSGEISAPAYLQLQKFDVNRFKTESRTAAVPPRLSATAGYLSSDAGQREAAEAQKNRRDNDLGKTLIGAQDTAVQYGGGAAGIAMGAAGQVFSGAASVFSGAVDRFLGGLGKGAAVATGTGTTIGAAATGTAVPTAAKAVAARAGLATLGTVGLIAGATLLPGDTAKPDLSTDASEAEYKKRHYIATYQAETRAADEQSAPGVGGWLARHLAPGTAESHRASAALAEQSLAALVGKEVAKELTTKTLRVQNVEPPKAPAGTPGQV